MLKLLIFDWDGTLADSINNIIRCKISLADHYNLQLPNEENIRSVIGLKFENALQICFPNTSPDILLKFRKDFHRLMQHDNYQSSLFPNARKVLSLFKKKYKLAITTSKSRVELDRALLYNDIKDIFDATCCGEEYRDKPSPAMLFYLMNKFKVYPTECLMIGDTSIDILFARNAEIKTIAVTFGAHTETELKTMNPIALIDDWEQLPKLLQKLENS